jgi:hypothetical protein
MTVLEKKILFFSIQKIMPHTTGVDVDTDPSPSSPASSSNEECANIFCKFYERNFKHKKSSYSFFGGCPGCVCASRLCDCNTNKKFCCYMRSTHISCPADEKMVIITKMKKFHESRLSTPCKCFKYNCCWLQTFPDDMKIAITKRKIKEMYYQSHNEFHMHDQMKKFGWVDLEVKRIKNRENWLRFLKTELVLILKAFLNTKIAMKRLLKVRVKKPQKPRFQKKRRQRRKNWDWKLAFAYLLLAS